MWHWGCAGRWRAPKFIVPVQTKFCITAEDFNDVHGLSLAGGNPKLVRWDQISDAEWFSVFRESKNRSQYRIKCSCLRTEMFDQVMQLHYKVYQKPPTNMEINSAFAKGFVKEFSPAAIASNSTMQFNWADFAVQYLQDLREKGYYETHVHKWRARNVCHNIEEAQAEMKEDTKETPISRHSSHQQAESLSFFGSENLQQIKAASKILRKQLQDAKEHLVAAKSEFEAARVVQASNARVTPIVLAIRQKLHDAENELQRLLQSDSVDVKREIECKVKIETFKETLEGLAFPDSDDTLADLHLDSTCQRVSR